MRWVALGLVVACSDPSATPVDASETVNDTMIDLVDPDWPADTALPVEFDFPPYLNLLAADTVVVSWRTMNASTGRVRFGTSPAYGTELSSDTAALVHHVSLASLAPATAYHYEVAIDGTSATRAGVFVTPGRRDWRFLAAGEYHAPSESSGVAGFADEIRAFRPHLLVESGDMVDDGNDLTHWRSYMRTAAPWISNMLLLPAHSNHVNGSDGNNSVLDYFVLPNNERWYTTRYGQAQFVTIDSYESANADVETVEVPWVAAEATAAHDGTDDPTFLIAAWHHPACSSFYASRAGSRGWVQDNLVSAFKANGGVDVIFAAHDKYYERSTITGGIVHVITNIGNISPESPGANHPDCSVDKTLLTTRSTALVSVAGNELRALVIDQTGAELDAFAIHK